MSAVQNWLDTMKDIWVSKEADRVADILAENLEYYETPTLPPLTTINAVVSEWQAIKSQDIELVDIELLYEHDNVGVAHWRFKQVGNVVHDGCYFIKLNDEGKCTYFRQWWNDEVKR